MKFRIHYFLRALFGYRQTWLMLGLLALSCGAFIVWFRPPPSALAALAALAALLIAYWIWLLRRDRKFQRRYHQLASGIDHNTLARLYRLARELREAGGDTVADQLIQLREVYDRLSRLLIRRVHHGEIVYGRHMAVADRVMLDALATAEALLNHPGGASAAMVAAVHDHQRDALDVFSTLERTLRHTPLTTPYERLRTAFDALEALGDARLPEAS